MKFKIKTPGDTPRLKFKDACGDKLKVWETSIDHSENFEGADTRYRLIFQMGEVRVGMTKKQVIKFATALLDQVDP